MINYRKLPQKPFKVGNKHHQNDTKVGFFCQSMPIHKKPENKWAFRIIVQWGEIYFEIAFEFLIASHFMRYFRTKKENSFIKKSVRFMITRTF